MIPYQSNQLTVVVPTKDRAAKLGNLMESLAGQTALGFSVIVVASGIDVESIVRPWASAFSIDYLHTEAKGQIYQRNLGLKRLPSDCRLVACLDDDIILASDAFEKVIAFWNETRPMPAAVGLNITNFPGHRHSSIKGVLGLSDPRAGIVLPCGSVTPITDLRETIRSEYVTGGTTIWRRDVLVSKPHFEISSKWAAFEDVIFSYPIGKNEPFYILETAHAIHDDVGVVVMNYRESRERYYRVALWRLYFVQGRPELSLGAFVRRCLADALIGILQSFRRPGAGMGRFMGTLGGLWKGLWVVRNPDRLVGALEN